MDMLCYDFGLIANDIEKVETLIVFRKFVIKASRKLEIIKRLVK